MNEFAEILENESLKKHTTLKVGGVCKYFATVYDEDSFIGLINFLNEKKERYFILGNGSNVIFEDGYFDGVVINTKRLNSISFHGNQVTVSSGVMLPKFCRELLDRGFVNFSFAAMIPGTIGGAF